MRVRWCDCCQISQNTTGSKIAMVSLLSTATAENIPAQNAAPRLRRREVAATMAASSQSVPMLSSDTSRW